MLYNTNESHPIMAHKKQNDAIHTLPKLSDNQSGKREVLP
jgi:hypothetical protein